MKSFYSLSVVHNGTPSHTLRHILRNLRLIHTHPIQAYAAATEFSKHPEVLHVRVAFIQETQQGIWRNGKRTKA